MFDIGWTELLVIAVVAIVAIGPKDLPLALKTVGHWVARARGLAREFQNSVDDMIREAELDKVKREVEEAANKIDVTKEIEATTSELEKSLEMPPIELDPTKTPESGEMPPAAATAADAPGPDAPPAEKPVESVAAPPPDAPVMPLPSTMPADEPEAKPQRAAGGQG